MKLDMESNVKEALVALIEILLASDTTTDWEESHTHHTFDEEDKAALRGLVDTIEYL